MSLRWMFAVMTVSGLMAAAHGQTESNPNLAGPILGHPYSAQQWTTTTSVHADGTSVTRTREVDIARNSAASIRHEIHQMQTGQPQTSTSATAMIFIQDVPNKQALHIDSNAKTASEIPLSGTTEPHITMSRDSTGKPIPTTNLGTKTLLDLQVKGFRTVSTSTASSSQQPVTITTDTWYSPDLHAVIEIDVQNSDGSASVTTLAHLVQGEPDSSLFTIPSGYTVSR